MYIDNTRYVRRTLDDIIKDLPPIKEGYHYFLGSRSAYFFVFATEEEYKAKIDKISEDLLKEAQKKRVKYERLQGVYGEPTKRRSGESKIAFENRMKERQLRKRANSLSYETVVDYVDNFIPLRQREVVEVRWKSVLEDDVAILIEGEEVGKAVDYKEYLESLKPKIPAKKVDVIDKKAPPPKKVENVYLGKRALLKPYNDDRYTKPYEGKIPKNFSKIYRRWADKTLTLDNAARLTMTAERTMRLLFYKAQQGEIQV